MVPASSVTYYYPKIRGMTSKNIASIKCTCEGGIPGLNVNVTLGVDVYGINHINYNISRASF